MIFNSECARNRLSAALHPGLLGELTALPNPLAGLKKAPERCAERGKSKKKTEAEKRGWERGGGNRMGGWEGMRGHRRGVKDITAVEPPPLSPKSWIRACLLRSKRTRQCAHRMNPHGRLEAGIVAWPRRQTDCRCPGTDAAC